MKSPFFTAPVLAAFLFFFTAFAPVSFRSGTPDEPGKSDPFSSGTFSGLKFRSIGPALTSGRVADIAVRPDDPSTYYVAAASGGVWKTTNAGTTWTPVFDKQSSYSIGCVAIDPNNPHVVWVGSGENNSQRSVSYGDGVYKSVDGGRKWKKMGLARSEHIAKILIDPRNSNVVYVAAQGPLWGPGGDRGLYKTTDGGATWKAVLSISENTGVTDVVMDPRDPDVLYAASYQRRRHVWTLINGGPESAIYKTTDGGITWNKLTSGLPSVDLGRIGLAVSPAEPDVVYAVVEAAEGKGGFFRSTDRGASWQRRSRYIARSPQYYMELVCDPYDVDRVYSLDTYTKVTEDGGKTFHNLGNKNRHVDDHAMWIDPDDTGHLLIAGDGGVYETFDRGATWNFKANLPITQFYRVALDNALPFYNVYGGTQDNYSMGGPSRTTKTDGIMNEDWFFTNTGDGFETQVDPENPNIIYAQSQYGGLVRFDKKSGERKSIKPLPGENEEPYRWNWNSPLIISPHAHTRLYFAANKVFRSDDRGDSWREISPDLTRRLDRNALPVMGKVWGVDAVSKNASTSLFGNIVALSESPVRENLLYAGTDDGLIQVTEDGGTTWRKIASFPGVPDMTYVSCVTASAHDEAAVYATFDNHKNADFKPYVLKSADRGKSWVSIAGNLPDSGSVYVLKEDHVNPDLLFAGTEFGVFFTLDGGKKWIQLKGGLPTIAVRDIAIQKRENDLVLATFGRGFYILDDYTPLRSVNSGVLARDGFIFPVKDALMYIQTGSRRKGWQGTSFFTAPNPPFGATFTYYLKETIKTKKQLRKEAEKETRKQGRTPPYPTIEQLREENEEEPPYLLFTVTDADGNVVRKLRAPATKGIHRVTWDLRYPKLTPVGKEEKVNKASAMLAMPGTYAVTMSTVVDGVPAQLTTPQPFNAVVLANTTLPAKDRGELVAFQKKIASLQRAVTGTQRAAQELKSRLEIIGKALELAPGTTEDMLAAYRGLKERTARILRGLNGDATYRKYNENPPPSVAGRLQRLVYGQWTSTSSPSPLYREQYRIVAKQFAPLLRELRNLVEVDVKKLENRLEAVGAPWTPGRLPEWKGE